MALATLLAVSLQLNGDPGWKNLDLGNRARPPSHMFSWFIYSPNIFLFIQLFSIVFHILNYS